MKGIGLKSLLCVAVMFCSVAVMAQPQRPEGGTQRGEKRAKMIDPEERAEKLTQRMASELELNEKQKKALLELNTTMAVDMKQQAELRRKEQEEMEAKRKAERKAMEEKMDKHQTAIMALLDDKQKIEYAKMLSRMQQRPQGGAHQGAQMKGGAPRKGGGQPAPTKCENIAQE